MAAASIQEYTDALTVVPGKRSLSDGLDEINWASMVKAPNAHYLHWGSGNFAVVFRCLPATGSDLALRCLLFPPSQDAAERAAAVSEYLRHLPQKPDSFVGYRFVPDAIYAGNEWRAAYVMDWVAGDTLSKAVYALVNDGDRGRLQAMSADVARMVTQMQEASIAHGDLQHENIMVLPTGDLRLVDYDSVYVPSLTGRGCLMVGVEGYAHPSYLDRSTVRPFNAHMDTFSGLVLITSLRAIASDFSLFQRFTQDNLFFRAEDFQAPAASPAFAALLSLGDAQLTALTNSLLAMCLDADKAQVPLSRVQGIVQERRKAPSPRTVEPALPDKLAPWAARALIGHRTFAPIFKNETPI